MNLKASLKYQLNDYKRAALIYYLVVFIVFTTAIILMNVFPRSNGVTGGLASGTLIFLFILGLNSFKDSSKMMLQNGTSRMTQFKAIILSIIILAFTLFLMDTVLNLLISLFVPNMTSMTAAFESNYPTAGAFTSVFNPLLWQFGLNIVATLIGLTITILYVRMSKGWKIAVSVSVPVFFFVAVPILAEVFEIRLLRPFVKFFDMIFGVNPYLDSILLFAGAGILTGICLLMARKAKFE